MTSSADQCGSDWRHIDSVVILTDNPVFSVGRGTFTTITVTHTSLQYGVFPSNLSGKRTNTLVTCSMSKSVFSEKTIYSSCELTTGGTWCIIEMLSAFHCEYSRPLSSAFKFFPLHGHLLECQPSWSVLPVIRIATVCVQYGMYHDYVSKTRTFFYDGLRLQEKPKLLPCDCNIKPE